MGSPKICVVITARDTEDVVETIGIVEAQRPDLIEIRLDYLEGPYELDVIRSVSTLPMIATNRGTDQGGLSPEVDSERMGPIIRACKPASSTLTSSWHYHRQVRLLRKSRTWAPRPSSRTTISRAHHLRNV